jgi:hypothetical protein
MSCSKSPSSCNQLIIYGDVMAMDAIKTLAAINLPFGVNTSHEKW